MIVEAAGAMEKKGTEKKAKRENKCAAMTACEDRPGGGIQLAPLTRGVRLISGVLKSLSCMGIRA